MAFVFSIANQKGGVGKTTTAVSLSHALAVYGAKVLLIDADPQSSATSGLNVQKKRTFYNFLNEEENIAQCIYSTQWSHLALLPSDPRLAGLDLEWADKTRRAYILRDKLKAFTSAYDYIFIDCPPSLGLLTVNALSASKAFIVPLQCEYYALEGLSLLLNTARQIKENLNPELALEGILLTMFDSRNTLSHKVAEQVFKHFKDRVFKTIIPRNVRLSEAPSHGLPILAYDSKSTGAEAYKKLAVELKQRMSKFFKKRENLRTQET